MRKGLKIFLLVMSITVVTLIISIFVVYKYNVYKNFL